MPNTIAQDMPTAHVVIGLAELAQVMSITPDKLKRNWRRWHAKLGMPRKHHATDVWPRRQIEVWLTSQAHVNATPSNDNTFEVPEEVHETRVAEQNKALRESLGVSG
ncbi:hypothetical protein [Roseibium album]|uniref:hypothetical protein n=1 Tax=Roseibium album TaxID=311410 RepID=UPI002491CB5C|nr:hypothetical protein [Roseibium album]